MRVNARTTLSCLTALALMCTLIGGCTSGAITGADVRADMSPELTSVAHTSEQMKNRKARTYDTNMRQIHDDIATILLEDRPSRLTHYPLR